MLTAEADGTEEDRDSEVAQAEPAELLLEPPGSVEEDISLRTVLNNLNKRTNPKSRMTRITLSSPKRISTILRRMKSIILASIMVSILPL